MASEPVRDRARRLLETNRTWAAYALADLDPLYAEGAHWFLKEGAAVLLYRALAPPVLFAHGDPQGVEQALAEVPNGRVQYTLKGVHRALLGHRLRAEKEAQMWRMVLRPQHFSGASGRNCEPLRPKDLSAINRLMGNAPDRPDAFSEWQLETGVFYGLRQAARLVAMAGTHVVSEAMDVAAVGNVFTHPDYRGQGLGRAVSAAVTASLLRRGLRTIVLNVAMDNEPAVHLYQDLGFRPFCGYYEGVGSLQSAHTATDPLSTQQTQ